MLNGTLQSANLRPLEQNWFCLIRKENMVYFFRDLKLANDLNKDLVSEKEQAIYLFLIFLPSMFLVSSVFLSNIDSEYSINTFDYILDLSMLIFTIILLSAILIVPSTTLDVIYANWNTFIDLITNENINQSESDKIASGQQEYNK